MAYICEKELRDIYGRLEPYLRKNGLGTEIALIRDYMLKIKLIDKGIPLGKLIVDYSPKKQSSKLRRDSDLSEEQFDRIAKFLEDALPAKEIKNPVLPGVSDIPYQAYVDGSFIDGNVGYGAVILENGNIAAEISGSVDEPDAVGARQVGGEIRGVIEVLEWCKQKNIKKIAIFYDFQNIEKWATGEYRTNTPMTRAYKEYIDNCGVDISWFKVQSHTGVALNDRADALAKDGARKI